MIEVNKKKNERLSKIISKNLEVNLIKEFKEKFRIIFMDILHLKDRTYTHIHFITDEMKVAHVLVLFINSSYLIYLGYGCSSNDIVDILNQCKLDKKNNEVILPIQYKYNFIDITKLGSKFYIVK